MTQRVKGGTVLLDEFLPSYHFSERHGLEIDAPPDKVFETVMRCDLSESHLVRWLFRLRNLPRGAIKLEGQARIGFRILKVWQDREVVIGLVGCFWTLSGGIVPIRADEFERFDAAGYAKGAFNFLLEPLDLERTALTTETRIWCTCPWSKRSFGFYWAMIRPWSGLIRREWLRLVRRNAER